MEGRHHRLFLMPTIAVATLSICSWSSASLAAEQTNNQPEPVIQPELDRRTILVPKIDTEDFEIGLYGGLMSVEDFGANAVVGVRAAYHLSEGIFFEAAIGTTKAGDTSFEILSGSAQLLPDDERQLTYYNLSIGYNLLPSEAFIGSKRAFNTDLYVIGGIGSTDFASDDFFTINLGVGYRFVFNDWMAFHFDMRDHIFEIDIIGEEKLTNNLETHFGVTFFF